jgi:hypothetical protein
MRGKVFANAIQHAVDELDRTPSRKAPRHLQRLVDHGSGGSFRVVEEFVQGHAQDVAVNGCHALQTPVVSMFTNQAVELVNINDCSFEQVAGKTLRRRSPIDRASAWQIRGIFCVNPYLMTSDK